MTNLKDGDPRGRVQRIFTWLIALGVMFSSGAHAQDEVDVEAIANDLKAFGQRLAALRADIDKSRFEPDEQVDRLDYDAELIIDFVSAEIVFHPYEGALRGPAGTLQSRAGNSLDQSLLLGYLLKSAGYDARIVRADLPETDALKLLLSTANASVPQSLDYLQDQVDALNAGRPISKRQPDITKTRLYKDTLAIEQRLSKSLEQAGISLDPTESTEAYLPLLKSYFWVQHRDGPSSEWQDVHPAFGSEPPPESLEPAEFFTEAIPAEHHHTFTISAWIEQWSNGKILTHQVMKPWKGPVANLFWQPLRYRNAPNGLNKDTADNLETALENTTMFFPTFNNAMAPGAQAFDMNGRPIDPFALSSPAAGIFQTIGDKFESATEGVADREDGMPVLALHSMYLEFTFDTPSGESDTRRRYLVAPRSSYDNDDEVKWALITDQTYVISVGDMPVDYLADRTLDVSQQSLQWLEFTIRKTLEPDVGAVLPEEMSSEVPPLIQAWSMTRLPLSEGIVRFRALPGLVGIRQGYRDARTGFTAVDVVYNRLEHLSVADQGVRREPRASMRNGVWETVLESIPPRVRQLPTTSVASTVSVFELAREQNIDTAVVSGEKEVQWADFGLDDNGARFAEDDLERGYAIVIPGRVPDGARMGGWWRVNPATGEALGMTADGYGQESAEYVLMEIIGTAKGLVDGLNAILECTKKPTMVTKLCCLVNAHADNVMGLATGGIMGTLLGTATASLWDSANTVAQETTGSGLLPSVGPMNCDALPDTDW